MNTATSSIRLTAAASAAVLAAILTSCANANPDHGPAAGESGGDAGQVAVRFVPSDNDPRGRHVVCEPLPDPVSSDDDPRGRHGLTPWEIAGFQRHLDAGEY